MLRNLIVGCLLSWSALCSGQGIADLVADEVCRCMYELRELVYPRLQARKCLETTANRYAAEIRSELGFRVNLSRDLDRLAETLASPLFEDCALLQEIGKDDREPGLRYSDIPAIPSEKNISSAKFPGPDPAAEVTREVPPIQRVTGTVVSDNLTEGLLVRIDGSQDTLRFLVTPRQLRRNLAIPGKAVTVEYSTEWHTDPAHIVYVLISITDEE